MAANGFNVPFSAVALSSGVAKTVVGVKAPANQAVKVLGIRLTFDGGTSTEQPVLCEYGTCTFATNPPGTNSTTVAGQKRDPGRQETVQTAAAKNWTAEPTVITQFDAMYVPGYNGGQQEYIPFDKPVIVPGGAGFVCRLTAQAARNCSGALVCEE